MTRVYGALHDVGGAVRTHLFGVAPNNSGSTFLKEALATCRATCTPTSTRSTCRSTRTRGPS